MKRIKFDAEQIDKIRQFASQDGCTVDAICNRFTLKPDTVRRLLWENKIVVNNEKVENNFDFLRDCSSLV